MRKAILETPFEKSGTSEGVRRGWETRRRHKTFDVETAERFAEQTKRAREREAKEGAKPADLSDEETHNPPVYDKDREYYERFGHIPERALGRTMFRKSKGPWKRGRKTLGDVVIGAARAMHPAKETEEERLYREGKRGTLPPGYRSKNIYFPNPTDAQPKTQAEKDFEEIRTFQKGDVFRMKKQELGKEETRRARKERVATGSWTPHMQRFIERSKERREAQNPFPKEQNEGEEQEAL